MMIYTLVDFVTEIARRWTLTRNYIAKIYTYYIPSIASRYTTHIYYIDVCNS